MPPLAEIAAYLGIGARVFVGLVVSVYVYVYARNWLRNLRDGL